MHTQQMEKMRQLNEKAYAYMVDIQKEHWARHSFSTHVKCDRLLNNLSESFNAWKPIAKARDQPIYPLLESIRRVVMKRFQDNRNNKKLVGMKLCPRIHRRLEAMKRERRFCIPNYAENYVYEVEDGEEVFSVNLKDYTCACRKWDFTGLSCRHAVSAIQHMNADVQDFVHPYYNVQTYLKRYEPIINPVLGPSLWKPSDHPYLLLLKVMNAPGRPPKQRKRSQKRIRNPDEPSHDGTVRRKHLQKFVTCLKCKEKGHNIRSCKIQKSSTRESATSLAKEKRKSNVSNTNNQPIQDSKPSSVASNQVQSQCETSSKPDKLLVRKNVKSMGFLVEDDRPPTYPTRRSTRNHITGYGLVQDGNEQRIGYAWSGQGPQPLVPPPNYSRVTTRSDNNNLSPSPRPTSGQSSSSSQKIINFKGKEKIVMSTQTSKK